MNDICLYLLQEKCVSILGLGGYVLKRLGQSLITIFLVLMINFLLFRVMPGDPVRVLFRDPRMTKEMLASLRASFGLDKPLAVQFVYYLVNTFQGNLGISFAHQRPVFDILAEYVGNTVLLVGTATVLAAVIGIGLGIIAGWKRGSKLDLSIMGFSLLTWAAPTFWVAMMVVVIFAGVLPVGGIVTTGANYATVLDYWADVLSHLILPASTLTLLLLGQFSLIMRSSMLDVLTQDYVLTAKAKGLTDRMILLNHVSRNAALPMSTLIAINAGLIVGGAIQIEIVFSWPGLGKLVWDSLLMRDYPVLQGAFLLLVGCVVVANFIADLVNAYLDPRIKV